MKRLALFMVLALGLLSAEQAMAQSKLSFRAIGANAAFVSPEDIDGTFGLGVFADMGQLAPRIGLEPTIEFWSKSIDEFGIENSIRDISVGARAKYYFEVANPKVQPFAGAGLGMHFLHVESSITVPGFGTVTADGSDTKLGLDIGGGVTTALNSKNDFRAEAWYGIVSDFNQFAVRVGISHKLGM